ncbi:MULTISPECIES: hypothetical protein [unclassified Micromonospora]|jgi:hypothetical protein|uniref:hypothetical protein n=1 Tax=Micromonospora TaxID=1873 RepID=UPI0024161CC6|nr:MULTISPECIES: hypothetical protein [unclassified Micromonospora]MDG4816262.1 hypothetical protein [Micromonospora sp. WMMD956]WFE58791.1 hypothetical protein O7633_18925 [Micromonospora sp. WMMD712]
MREIRISRRGGLAALGAGLGAALLGTSRTDQARAASRGAPSHDSRAKKDAVGYSVTISNASALDGMNAILFQENPVLPSDAVTLAWMSKMCHPSTTIEYKWTIDYNFVWGQVGTLVPGTQFVAGQILAADLTQNNQVGLSYVDGGFEFGPTGPSGKNGSLIIKQDDSVPGPGNDDQGSVGIGMSGAGTFVVPTVPNLGVEFDPKPTYWLAFGSFASSEVMDISELTQPAKLVYPVGMTSAKAVFDGKEWNISYGN